MASRAWLAVHGWSSYECAHYTCYWLFGYLIMGYGCVVLICWSFDVFSVGVVVDKHNIGIDFGGDGDGRVDVVVQFALLLFSVFMSNGLSDDHVDALLGEILDKFPSR